MAAIIIECWWTRTMKRHNNPQSSAQHFDARVAQCGLLTRAMFNLLTVAFCACKQCSGPEIDLSDHFEFALVLDAKFPEFVCPSPLGNLSLFSSMKRVTGEFLLLEDVKEV